VATSPQPIFVPVAPRGKAQNKRPACALSAIFGAEWPSTEELCTAGAQQVNLVVRSAVSFANAIKINIHPYLAMEI